MHLKALAISAGLGALCVGSYILGFKAGYAQCGTELTARQIKREEEVMRHTAMLTSRNSTLSRQLDTMKEVINTQRKYNVAEFKITAYSPYDDHNGINSDGSPSVTSIGLMPGPTVFAVDPDIIPYRSKVVIIYEDGTVQQGIAGDTGGAIQGNHIDIFKSTYNEAIKFGVKKATVVWYK